jgi:hypothetical protein
VHGAPNRLIGVRAGERGGRTSRTRDGYEKEAKQFFFEKKNRKTFICYGLPPTGPFGQPDERSE